MSSHRDDDGQKVLPIVVIPDSVVFRQSGGQLMVAMQPGVDLPAVEVQEVVVVTDRGRRLVVDRSHEVYDGQRYVEMHNGVEGEMEVDYDDGSEAVAAEIEVADAGEVRSIEEFLVNGVRNRAERVRGRSKKSRFKRRGRHFKKSMVKTIIQKRRRESSPEFDDSDSDLTESAYGRSPHKPRKRDFALRLQWRDEDMQEAMKAVHDQLNTIRGAAKKFNVPYSTLKDRVRNRVKHGTKPGVKTALSPEDEEELVRCIQQMEAAGFQLHGINIREQAHELLNQNCGSNARQRATAPGHNWLAGFLKRHEGITIKRSVNRPVTPSISKQKQMIRRFFDATHDAYRKFGGLPRANQVYTMTELKLSYFPHASVIIVASADGAILPPYVLFNSSRVLMSGLQQIFPSAFFSIFSSAGLRRDVLFSWFRDHFLSYIHPNSGRSISDGPIVLFICEPIGDISVRFVQLANDCQVSLVCIPLGVSHLIQPLNDIALRELDDLISKRGRKHLEERKMSSPDQRVITEVLHKVWQKGMPSKDIVANFKENGLFPFNVRAVTNERITSSTPVTDVSRAEVQSSDTEANGLTLLSELSSLEHGDQSVNETNTSFDFKGRPSRDNDHKMSPVKRQKYSTDKQSYGFGRMFTVDSVNGGSTSPRLSEELMKHVLASENREASCSRTRPVPRTERRFPDVRQEILASKTNPEQLEIAIKSIVEENSETAFMSQRCLQPGSTSNSLTLSSSGFGDIPVRRNLLKSKKMDAANADVLSTESSVSKSVTFHRVIALNPTTVKQELISYTEDPHTMIQEEFVPQEIVEEQTILDDCTAYEMPSDAYCKEEVIEELVEEVVDLPDLMLSVEEVVDQAEVKLENTDCEYMNNNELNYDLQSGVNGTAHSQLNPVKYLEFNGRSYPVIRTLSLQEFRKTFGGASQTFGSSLREASEVHSLDKQTSTRGRGLQE